MSLLICTETPGARAPGPEQTPSSGSSDAAYTIAGTAAPGPRHRQPGRSTPNDDQLKILFD